MANIRAAPVRMVTIDGNPWFLAIEAYAILFGRTTGISARQYLDEAEVLQVRRVSASGALSSLFTTAGQYRLNLLSESALYKLVLRSDKPQAKLFQDWVTKVVLPALRKYGGYIMGEDRALGGGSGLSGQDRGHNVPEPCSPSCRSHEIVTVVLLVSPSASYSLTHGRRGRASIASLTISVQT